MPPAPSGETTSYGPSRVPEGRGISGRRLSSLTPDVNRTTMRTLSRTEEDVTEMPLMTMRQRLTGINRELQKSPETVIRVTHRGKPALAVMSAELYDGIVETLDVMSDPEAVEALRGSLADLEGGKVRSLDEVARRLHRRRCHREPVMKSSGRRRPFGCSPGPATDASSRSSLTCRRNWSSSPRNRENRCGKDSWDSAA